ncbi:MAG: 16S rRNA (cytidine(1402)-2'-O)-methyltransferase [Chlamydiia bacterium]|nr:16S rRNA (cytidine(1402)-2'-O)-methyltransferase [Chlamydiia bacterium]
MLILVSTPIGNLQDITLRSLDVLRSCDLILCEDTRVSINLLKHFEIETPLQSFHKFNEAKTQEKVIEALKAGKKIALISDAGTPAINDPGLRLVQACLAEGIAVSASPGACSAIVALTLSGLETSKFQYLGFIPKKQGEKLRFLAETIDYSGTSILFESPERILDTLEMLSKLIPERPAALARELTKTYEEVRRKPVQELWESVRENPPRGEMILMIGGSSTPAWSGLSPQEHMALLQKEFDINSQDALKLVAYLRDIPKRALYSEIHIKNIID